MDQQHRRPMWQHPWHWKESIAFVSGILLTGLLLQLTVGEFDFELLRYPVNTVVGAVIVLLAAAIAWGTKRSAVCRWYTGVPLAVTLIVAFVVTGIIMGLTPQSTARPAEGTMHITSRLGLDRMTRAWPFVLLYFLTLLSLGALFISFVGCSTSDGRTMPSTSTMLASGCCSSLRDSVRRTWSAS